MFFPKDKKHGQSREHGLTDASRESYPSIAMFKQSS
jgi:hypothetical protein